MDEATATCGFNRLPTGPTNIPAIRKIAKTAMYTTFANINTSPHSSNLDRPWARRFDLIHLGESDAIIIPILSISAEIPPFYQEDLCHTTS